MNTYALDTRNNHKSRSRKYVLTTCQKMKVLSALNSDTVTHLHNKPVTEEDESFEDISEHGKQVLLFLQNEQSYINALKKLQTFVLHPALRENVASLDDVITLVNQMIVLHENLYEAILSGEKTMTDAAKQLHSCIKLYTSYSVHVNNDFNNYEKFGELYGDSESAFHQLLHEPVMHISRYKDLFQKLFNAMPTEIYKDFLFAIEEATAQMNNKISVQNNFLRIFQIQKLLYKRQPKILNPERILLKEGPLFEVKAEQKRLKDRVFFLFSDIILCCKRLNKYFKWCEQGSLKCCSVLPLNKCSVSLVMGSFSEAGALFKLTCGDISYLLLSKVPGEAQSWIKELQLNIQLCQNASVTESKPKLKKLKRNNCVKKRASPYLKCATTSVENIPSAIENNVTVKKHVTMTNLPHL